MPGPDLSASGGGAAEFAERAAALRQAASLPRAEPGTLLDAALAELDGAIAALAEANEATARSGDDGRALSGLHSERRLLHALFTAVPVPLYVVDSEGTVLRANSAACGVLGVGPGYATGKALTTLVEPAARAALRSQLAAVGRTGEPARLTCGMAATGGVVRSELVISPVRVRGDADRLLVALSPASQKDAPSAECAQASNGSAAGDAAGAGRTAPVATAAGRLDLLAAAARLLLESASISESVLLQRCTRLLSASVATWAVVDLHRREQLRRHYVAGPDDPESSGLAHAMATSDP
ncbi:MAG TPA: PAS domain-containing protein, partial [Streptosporangiaceae bacterium]|nr:PAS domain-containing protein [Streptosporangiaceae bacterium]